MSSKSSRFDADDLPIRISYNAGSKKLRYETTDGIDWELEKEVSKDFFHMKDTHFVVKEGERAGCAATGNLGFLVGKESACKNKDVKDHKKISWSGEEWLDESGKTLDKAKDVIILDGKIYAR